MARFCETFSSEQWLNVVIKLSRGDGLASDREGLGGDIASGEAEAAAEAFLLFLCLADVALHSAFTHDKSLGGSRAIAKLTDSFVQPVLKFLSLFGIGYACPVFTAVSYVSFVRHALQLDEVDIRNTGATERGSHCGKDDDDDGDDGSELMMECSAELQGSAVPSPIYKYLTACG